MRNQEAETAENYGEVSNLKGAFDKRIILLEFKKIEIYFEIIKEYILNHNYKYTQ